MANRIPTTPLTEVDHAWIERQPRPTIGDVVAEMNERFLSYKANSSMSDKAADKQTRQDFRSFGSMDKNIVLTDGKFLPYKRQEAAHGKK